MLDMTFIILYYFNYLLLKIVFIFPVEKPPDVKCEEPKKMECGFGQVLKQKTKPNGCKEFACGKFYIF